MTDTPAAVYDEQNIIRVDSAGNKTVIPDNGLINKIEEWRSAFGLINDAVIILSNDHRIFYSNRTAEIFFKQSASEMIGKTCRELFFCKEDLPAECPVNHVKQGYSRGKSDRKIGEEWFQVTVDPMINAKGSCFGFIFIARKITRRKQAEKALQDAEYKYHMLFDKMLNIFALHEIICDENGKPVDYRYLELNPAFEKITGRKVSETLGKTALEIFPGVAPVLIENYGKVALTGEPLSFEFFNIYTDQYFLITAYQPEEGKFACVLQDVSEQKRAEKALMQSKRELKKNHDELEQRVLERTEELEIAYENLQKKTKKLEKVNTAISVLLEKRESDKVESGEEVLLNVKELLIPYIEKLKSTRLNENQKKYIGLLESGINDIISPFARKLTSRYMNITPRELQVADLVKKGRTSKEIAAILHTTERTAAAHRINLRKKLGLRKRANLRTYLLSLSS